MRWRAVSWSRRRQPTAAPSTTSMAPEGSFFSTRSSFKLSELLCVRHWQQAASGTLLSLTALILIQVLNLYLNLALERPPVSFYGVVVTRRQDLARLCLARRYPPPSGAIQMGARGSKS